jgi:hypothetical protein
MSEPRLLPELCAGPYIAQVYDRDSGVFRRYEVEIWGEGDFQYHKITRGVRLSTTWPPAGSGVFERLRDKQTPMQITSGPAVNPSWNCAEKLQDFYPSFVTLESFPGYRLAPDDQHHVFFKDRQHGEDHEITR